MPPKKPIHRVTLQLTAGAGAVSDLGKMLGPTGVDLVEVKRRYDRASAAQCGDVVPVEVTVFDDRSFELRLRTPPTSFLIRRAVDGTGSGRPGHQRAGTLSRAALRAIAERKLPDLNTTDVEAAMRTVAGTARSMGVPVAD
ncbi:uL11 family ribosomal protein [Pseudonocardia sp.]|uniref:uL11 family ribosomal protein n=1 Tax=Pseudonocardia sp. TaxID=60912 RepID=UPI0026046B21|nr:uL11 family ribosomal protein [Pseudonocardia sp.]